MATQLMNKNYYLIVYLFFKDLINTYTLPGNFAVSLNYWKNLQRNISQLYKIHYFIYSKYFVYSGIILHKIESET